MARRSTPKSICIIHESYANRIMDTELTRRLSKWDMLCDYNKTVTAAQIEVGVEVIK